jgi:ABC-type phosphate transport system substrate-binding protein
MKKSIRSVALATTAFGLIALTVPASASVARGSGLVGDPDLTASTASVTVAGSTFDAPLIQLETASFTVSKIRTFGLADGKVTFSPNPYPTSGTNSGSGYGRGAVTQTSTGNGFLATVGFSDQPMEPTAGTAPTFNQGDSLANYVQVPYALGGGVIAYNLPGVTGLHLTPTVIAEIYNGVITSWADPQILGLQSTANAGFIKSLSAANKQINVAVRSGGGGTNFAFEQYLADYASANKAANPSCTGSYALNAKTGAAAVKTGPFQTCYFPSTVPETLYGKQIQPTYGWGNGTNADTALGTTYNVNPESGNGLMVSFIEGNPGAIGYVEASYVLLAQDKNLQMAMLPNASTNAWMNFTTKGVSAAAAAAGALSTSNFDINNQMNAAAWPFATFSWAIVPKKSDGGTDAQGNAALDAAVKFLDWNAGKAGSILAPAAGYAPLPTAVQTYADNALSTVMCGSTACLNLAN